MRRAIFYIVLGFLFLITGCASQNLFVATQPYSVDQLLNDSIQNEHVIVPDDKVSVSIWGHDDLSVGSVFSIYNSNEVYGKWLLVDKAGYVNLPQLGKTRFSGMSVQSLTDSLTQAYSQYLKKPVVVVKVLNKQVTILGEVIKPGNFNLEKEVYYIPEVIGMAGGFDFYADKSEILLIRTSNETEQTYKLDLTGFNEQMLRNITLKSGDVIYVPARKSKIIDKRSNTLIPVASFLSALAVLSTLVF